MNWVNIAGIAVVALSAFYPAIGKTLKVVVPKLLPKLTPAVDQVPLTSAGEESLGPDGCCVAANTLVAVLLNAKRYDLAKEATALAQRIGVDPKDAPKVSVPTGQKQPL
jgi:hypothetical protein